MITIAHRISTVIDVDNLLVMDNGCLVEYDHPYLLLVNDRMDTKITKK